MKCYPGPQSVGGVGLLVGGHFSRLEQNLVGADVGPVDAGCRRRRRHRRRWRQ